MDQIIYKDPKPKRRLFLKLISKGTWRQVFICLHMVSTQPIPPPVTHCMNHAPVLIHTEKVLGDGVGEPVRKLEWRLFTRGVENTNTTDCISPAYKLY
jgi:hypothetical protein